jgi:hypothetical protein
MRLLRSVFKNSTKKSDKRVSFESGTHFDHGRNSVAYSRSSRYYEPGSHAAPEDDTLEDTSFFQNLHFNFMQLKVYTSTLHDINSIMGACTAPSQDEGIVEYHPRVSEIKDILNSQDQSSALKDFLGWATWLLLAADDDELVEIFLHETLEESEHQSDHDEMVEMFLQQAVENSKNQSYVDPELIGPSDEG